MLLTDTKGIFPMERRTHTWLVDGTDMRTRSRMGGRNSLKGFEFQAAHAVHMMTQLLTCEGSLVQLRYEGAQDIDLMLGHGRQLFIQYKETGDVEYTFDAMKDILHGFMRDAVDACGHPPDLERLADLRLGFLLVTTGVFVGEEIISVLRKTKTKVKKLAAQLAADFVYDENKLDSLDDCQRIAAYVLDNVEFQVHPKLRGINEPELMAIGRLALFGVPPSRIAASIAQITQLLTPPRKVFPADVAHCLDGLPDEHPASGRGCINFLPSENCFPARALVAQEFRDSGRVTWPAIHFELDIARDAEADIRAKVMGLSESGGLVLVSGAAASGKSTLVRRIGWELHRSGAALVLEMTNPAVLDKQSWDELIRLAGLTVRPVVVIVDDIDSYSQVFDQLRRRSAKGVVILSTDKDRQCVPKNVFMNVLYHALETVSANEFARLETKSGRILGDKAKEKLSPLMRHGEMFAVSLLVQGSSLNTVADQTLLRLRRIAPELETVFLGLCACGANDQTMPASLFLRMLPLDELWEVAKRERLVFVEGNNRVRSGHAALASSIVERSGTDAATLKIVLLEDVDFENATERRFALGLVLNGLDERSARDLARYPLQLEKFASSIIRYGEYLDIRRCARAIDAVVAAGATKLAGAVRHLKAALIPERVRSGQDAIAYLNDTENFAVAYGVVSRIFASPTVTFGRSSFMRWVTEQGRGHADLQREAVTIHFNWLQHNAFPVAETYALVNFIHEGNYKLTDELRDEYARLLHVVLAEVGFSAQSRPELVLLYSVCDTIRSRIRKEDLYDALLATVMRNFPASDLARNVYLLRHLMSTANDAGGEKGRRAVLRHVISILPLVPPHILRAVGKAMVKVVAKECPSLLGDWSRKFKTTDPADVPTLTKDFVDTLQPYLVGAGV
ncbi:P-loop NTPase [Massilia timonae]|nr:ATP-binding protein [Massilia timonae]